MSDGNRWDNLAFDHFVGEFPRRPVCDGSTGLFRRFAGHRDNLCDLLGGEFAAATGAGTIAEDFGDGLTQHRGFFGALDDRQRVERLLPASPPDTDAVPLATQTLGNDFVLATFERQQDNFGTMGETLRRRPRLDYGLQDYLLTLGNNHLGSHPWHDRPSGPALAKS